MRRSDRNFTKIPDGKLGIIALEGCKELGKQSTTISSSGDLKLTKISKTLLPVTDI